MFGVQCLEMQAAVWWDVAFSAALVFLVLGIVLIVVHSDGAGQHFDIGMEAIDQCTVLFVWYPFIGCELSNSCDESFIFLS